MGARFFIRNIAFLFVFAAASQTHSADQIVIDGSTGVMPLVRALADAYREHKPEVAIHIGKGLGTKARIAALREGKIRIAMASHVMRPRCRSSSLERSPRSSSIPASETFRRRSGSNRDGSLDPRRPGKTSRATALSTGTSASMQASSCPVLQNGTSRLSPKGRVVLFRNAAVLSKISSGERYVAPRIPRPPAFETAATRLTPITGMPADRIGCSIPRISVTRVRILLLLPDTVRTILHDLSEGRSRGTSRVRRVTRRPQLR